jgi:hypothetical protein
MVSSRRIAGGSGCSSGTALLDSSVESNDWATRGLVELCQLADRVIREVESKPSVGVPDLEPVPGFFEGIRSET